MKTNFKFVQWNDIENEKFNIKWIGQQDVFVKNYHAHNGNKETQKNMFKENKIFLMWRS